MALLKGFGARTADFGPVRLESQSHPDLTPASPFDMVIEDARGPQTELKGDVHYCLQFSIVLAGAAEVMFGDWKKVFTRDQIWWTMCWEPHAFRILMKENNFESMTQVANDTTYKGVKPKDFEDEKQFRKDAQKFLTKFHDQLLSTPLEKGYRLTPDEASLYRKLLKRSVFQFGPYFNHELNRQDTTTLKTELDYYYEHDYDQAWYDDNVGSFLIVVEKNYRE